LGMVDPRRDLERMSEHGDAVTPTHAATPYGAGQTVS
jgi:hypothetical protein